MSILMENLPVIVYMWEYHLFYELYNKQGKWLLPIIRGKSQMLEEHCETSQTKP